MKKFNAITELTKNAFTNMHQNFNKPIKFIFAVLVFTLTLSTIFYTGILNSHTETTVVKNGVQYTLNSPSPGQATASGYTGDLGATAVISATIEDDSNSSYTVTSIGSQAFLRASFTSITIPDSVTYIGSNAFALNSNLTSITIPNSVTTMEGGVFNQCTNLSNVTLSNSITSIGNGTFFQCNALQNINIPASVTSIGERVFSYCFLKSLTFLGTEVTTIGNNVFEYCALLEEIYVPEGFNFNCFQNSGLTVNNYNYNISSNGYTNGNFHIYEWVINEDNQTHKKHCTICGKYSNNENHSSFLSWNHNETQHWQTCICGYATTASNHNITSYSDNHDGTHTGACTVCSAITTENHNMQNWTDNHDGTHTGTCTSCTATSTEFHTFGSTPSSSTEPLDENFGVDKYPCDRCDNIKRHYTIKENTNPTKYPNIDQVPPDNGEDVITDSTPKASASTVIVQDPFGAINAGNEFDLNVENIENNSENYNNYVSQLSNYSDKKNIKFFNINPQIDNENISGELYNPVRLLFEVPEGWNTNNIKIVLLTESGNVEFSQKPDTIESKNYVTAWTNHFSTYAIIDTSNDGGSENPEPNNDNNNNSEDTSNNNTETSKTDENTVQSGDNTAAWITGLCVLILVSGLILISIKRSKNHEKTR